MKMPTSQGSIDSDGRSVRQLFVLGLLNGLSSKSRRDKLWD